MSKCKITGKVLVIHLGREEVRIVRMNGAEIQHRASFITPKGAMEDGEIRNTEAMRELLKTALKTKEFRGIRQAVFVLNTSQVIQAVTSTPCVSEAKLEKLLQANMDMYFRELGDVSEYHVVWQVMGTKAAEGGSQEQEVQLWAVPNAITQRYYTVANACGLSVAAIDYCGHSIATAVGADFAYKARAKAFGRKKKEEVSSAPVAVAEGGAPETELHVTLEKELLGMTFVQEGRVVLQRFVRCGGDPAYQFSELAMILEFFYSMDSGRSSRIQGVLSGDYAGDRELCRELEDMLGIPLRVISEPAPQMVMFVGAARTAVDFGISTLNKPGQVRREVQSQLWQYLLILASGVVLIGVILWSLSSQLVWDASVRSLENDLQAVSVQAQQTAGFADNYKKYEAIYDSYSADWDTVYASLQTYNDNLALVLQELEEIMPEDSSVTAMQIAADGMSVQFACETKEEAAFLIMALRELKYAELAMISSLGGGGGGAAESYGPQEETPPTKGSNDSAGDGTVTVTFSTMPLAESGASEVEKLISQELSEEEIMGLATSLTTEQINALEKSYGKVPATKFSTLEALKKGANPKPVFADRKAAMETMFSSDPFAGNRFIDLLMEDIYRENSILMKYILFDIMDLQAQGKLTFDPSNPGAMQESMDVLLEVLTKDETTLAATEELLCSEKKLEGKDASASELTYVHYLEVQLRLRSAERFPFLDLDGIFEDLLNGGFDTGDKSLDEKLNGMISQETWALLKELGSEASVSKMVADYLRHGTSGEPLADELIAAYLRTGTTGYKSLDDRLAASLAGDEMSALIEEQLGSYLTLGTTGNTQLNNMFDAYFIVGSTGNTAIDAQVRKCMAGSAMETLMTEQMGAYLFRSSTGNATLNGRINKYLFEGSCGNNELDGLFGKCLSSGSLDSGITEHTARYKTAGSSGSRVLDSLIDGYVRNGSCGNLYLDRIFSTLIETEEDPLGGRTEEELGTLTGKYLETGASGDSSLDKKLNSYFSQKTSGNDAVDKAAEKYLRTAQAEQLIKGLVDKYLTDGTAGNTVANTLIGNFFSSGSTGNGIIDDIIENHIEGGGADSLLDALVTRYVEEGSTGIPALDKKLSKYSAEGTTGSTKLDSLLRAKQPQTEENPFAGKTDSQIKDMLDKYFTTGTTGNVNADIMLDRYMATGSTGDPAMDTFLKSYTAKPEADGYLTQLLIKYLANGTTGRVTLDKMIDGFILEGTTGNPAVDVALIGALGTSVVVKDSIVGMLDSYLAVGTTGNLVVDKAFENYLLKGTTGNKNLDKVIEDYLEETSDGFEAKIDKMFEDYLTNGTTNYIVFDKLIDKYLETGTTGNRYADVVMKEYTTVKLEEMFRNYLNEGTSGNPGFDKLIEGYLLKGTTGNPGFDRLIDQYMESGAVKVMLKDLVDKYNATGKTGNEKIDLMFKMYENFGTTSNKKLDAMLKELGLKTKVPGGTTNPDQPDTDVPDDFWENLFGPGGSTGGTGTGPVDTRVTFTVVLMYNEELANAELVRKGLDYDGKLDKVEVEG